MTEEHKECIIYEIVGRKVGSSIIGHKRPKSQLKEDETYRILQVIPPNTLTLRECWETECEWQMKLNYPVENEGSFRIVEKARSAEQGLFLQTLNKEMLANGTHPWQQEEHKILTSIHTTKMNKEMLANGTHPWQQEEHKVVSAKRMTERNKSEKGRERSREIGTKVSREMAANGTHPWQQEEHRKHIGHLTAERNKINNKVMVTCPHCDKTGMSSGMKRWHFDHCKMFSK